MANELTSRQRAYLLGLSNETDACVQVGKNGLTPDVTRAVEESFNTKELVKISVLKSCEQAPAKIADVLSERTRSVIVRVIGRRIILYRESREHKAIILP